MSLQSDLQELKLALRAARHVSSEIKEAHFALVGITLGLGKTVFDKDEGAVYFISNAGNTIWLGDVDPDAVPECGILLDYAYIRYHIGHVHAMQVVRAHIADAVQKTAYLNSGGAA